MNHFFKVQSLKQVLDLAGTFAVLPGETVPLRDCHHRILCRELTALQDLPGFRRSTMDGYALRASDTFGASESSPAWLKKIGTIAMGGLPDVKVSPGEAVAISTGGMLPEGADSVVMVEHTEPVDETTVEVYKSVAPLQNVVEKDEDFSKGQCILEAGTRIRPQEAGVLASQGMETVPVHRRPVVAVISTGDEIVDAREFPGPGQIRDMNTHTLSGLILSAGGVPLPMGIVRDDRDQLFETCKKAVSRADMVLISGGSSVGMRDFTVAVLSELENTELLVHGISLSPGKPTLLARSGNKPVWGLPGHVVSAMVVFQVVVRPFLNRIMGMADWRAKGTPVRAVISRNVASAQGRSDFVRVRLETRDGQVTAVPILGKSGLIRTMVRADGLLEIGENTEGVTRGDTVIIRPMQPW